MSKSASTWIGRDLPPFTRGGFEYFLLSHNDELYLIHNHCPHRSGPLKFGYVNEHCEIVCPMHGNAFSVEMLIARKTTLRLNVEGKSDAAI